MAAQAAKTNLAGRPHKAPPNDWLESERPFLERSFRLSFACCPWTRKRSWRQICGAPATREADPRRFGGVKRDLLNERFTARQQGWRRPFQLRTNFGQHNLPKFERAGARPASPEWPILCSCALGHVIREQANEAAVQRSKRKTGNHEPHSDRGRTKRTERIEELERRVAQLEQELVPARKAIERVKELEIVAAERAHLLNEKDKELAVVREAVTNRYLRVQELERTLAEISKK
jgi:hypothetical protein